MAVGDSEIQLADVDTTVPNQSTQQKSVLDNYQRAIRRTGVASIGRSHHLTGEHKFGQGTAIERDQANQLAGPVTGDWWFRTDNSSIERYDGTKWARQHVFQPQSIALINSTGDNGNNAADLGWAVTDIGNGVYWMHYPFFNHANATWSSLKTLATVPVYLQAGIYDFLSTIKFNINSYTTTATVTAQVVISGASSVTIASATSKVINADTWTDNITDGSASTGQTISASGWHTAQIRLRVDSWTQTNTHWATIGITAASLYWEPSTNG